VAVKEILLFEYTCDAEVCNAQSRVAVPNRLPNSWRTGTVEDSQGDDRTWHACTPSHVEEAVETVYSWRDNV
jgi:hypothetical protein